MDAIRWFNFMEEKTLIILVTLQESHYQTQHSLFTIKTWGSQLV